MAEEVTTTATGGEGGAAPAATAPPPATAAQAESFVLSDEQGNLAENWWEHFDELKPHGATLQNFKTIQGLGKSFANTKAMVGKKFEPGQFADEQEESEFYKKLGVPEDSTGYEFKAPENLPEGITYNEEETKWFANIAKEAKLTKEQANLLRNKYNELHFESWKTAQAHQEQAFEQARETLAKEWGQPDSSTYKAEMSNAQKAINALEEEEGEGTNVRAEIEKMGLQNYPPLFKLLAKLGRNVGESEFAGIAMYQGGQTKDQLNARLNEIKTHPGFLDKSHPQHGDLMREKEKIYQSLYPEPQKTR